MQRLEFSEAQAQAILDLQLRRLSALERQKIIDEYEGIIRLIAELEDILANEASLRRVIVNELEEVKKDFGDARRTQIIDEGVELSIEDMIADEDVAITVTKNGYVKRTPVSTYQRQGRGGKGRRGASTGKNERLRRAPLHRLDPLVPDDLHRRRAGLQAEGARDTGRAPLGARQGRREPHQHPLGAQAGGRRPRARVRRGALRRDGHAQGRHQEDRAVRVPEHPHERHQRHQRGRRRRAARRRADRRHQAHLHRHARRPRHPLRRVGRAADGARGARRARHRSAQGRLRRLGRGRLGRRQREDALGLGVRASASRRRSRPTACSRAAARASST